MNFASLWLLGYPEIVLLQKFYRYCWHDPGPCLGSFDPGVRWTRLLKSNKETEQVNSGQISLRKMLHHTKIGSPNDELTSLI